MPGTSQRHIIFLLHIIDTVVDSFPLPKFSKPSFVAVAVARQSELNCTLAANPRGCGKLCSDAS